GEYHRIHFLWERTWNLSSGLFLQICPGERRFYRGDHHPDHRDRGISPGLDVLSVVERLWLPIGNLVGHDHTEHFQYVGQTGREIKKGPFYKKGPPFISMVYDINSLAIPLGIRYSF